MKAEKPIAPYNGNPQKENGYTPIANELLEAIVLFKFSERQYKILFALIRKTYGFNKSSDDISLSQLSIICNLPINHVSTVIKQLVDLNVIIKTKGKHAFNLSINKLYDDWGGLHNMEFPNMELHKMDKRVTSLGVLGLHNMEVQKTTPKDNTKDNIAKVKTSAISLQTFIEKCKQENKPVLDSESIVFKNADKLKIESLWLRVCWLKFKEVHIEKNKRQVDWIKTFNNCVKDNWYKFWFKDNDGNMNLTSQGRIAIDFYRDKLDA